MKKLVLLLAAFAILSVSCNAQGNSEEDVVADDPSYAFGMAIAYNFKDIAIDLDYDAFLSGMKDVLDKDAPKFTMEEAESIIQAAITEAMTKQAEVALAKEQEFLTENGKKEGVFTTPSGLQYEVLKTGTGPKPNASDIVTVHYTGTFLNGEVFDSSVQRGEPADLQLDAVIPGWTEGIQLMNVGSSYKLYIPSTLAYGTEGAGGVIGPNETLVFEVELLGTKASSGQ